MNRRDALKLLGGLPLLAFLKPEAVEAKVIDHNPSLDYTQSGRDIFEGIIQGLEASAGDLLEQSEQVTEAMVDQTLAFGPDDTLYIGGAFVTYQLVWDGESFSTLK